MRIAAWIALATALLGCGGGGESSDGGPASGLPAADAGTGGSVAGSGGPGGTGGSVAGSGGRGGSGGSVAGSGGSGGDAAPTPADASSGADFPPDASTPSDAIDVGMSTPPAQCTDPRGVELLPGAVDLLFMVDISGSMGEVVSGKTKWVGVRDALVAFSKDGRSAGLGMGLHFFPPPAPRCTTNNDCTGLLGNQCERRGVCSAGDVTQAGQTCNAATQTTCFAVPPSAQLPCVPVGHCAKTGLYCKDVGQPCPGGLADDVCLARPSLCSANAATFCDSAFYASPTVTLAELPGNEPKLSAALADVFPAGSTPTTAAVLGAITHLRARAMAMGGRKSALVLATDGLPQGCAPDNNISTAASHLAAGFMGQGGAPSIPTYVIGVFSAAEAAQANAALSQLAAAGGTGMPFLLSPGPDLGQRFLDALNTIRGRAAGCEFAIPAPSTGAIDFNKVNVRWTGAGGPTDVMYVGSANRCDPIRGGWHYDIDPATGTPSRMRLCEATCNQLKGSAQARVEVAFGCRTVL